MLRSIKQWWTGMNPDDQQPTPLEAQVLERMGWRKEYHVRHLIGIVGHHWVKPINHSRIDRFNQGGDEWDEDLIKVQENPYCFGSLKQPIFEVTFLQVHRQNVGAWTEDEARESIKKMYDYLIEDLRPMIIDVKLTEHKSILMNPADVDTRGD